MLSRAVYLICDCCGNPGETECFDVTRRGAERGNPDWRRIRADGRVLDICARCRPDPPRFREGYIPARCHSPECRNPNARNVFPSPSATTPTEPASRPANAKRQGNAT